MTVPSYVSLPVLSCQVKSHHVVDAQAGQEAEGHHKSPACGGELTSLQHRAPGQGKFRASQQEKGECREIISALQAQDYVGSLRRPAKEHYGHCEKKQRQNSPQNDPILFRQEKLVFFTKGKWINKPLNLIVFVLFAVLVWFVMSKTKLGYDKGLKGFFSDPWNLLLFSQPLILGGRVLYKYMKHKERQRMEMEMMKRNIIAKQQAIIKKMTSSTALLTNYGDVMSAASILWLPVWCWIMALRAIFSHFPRNAPIAEVPTSIQWCLRMTSVSHSKSSRGYSRKDL